MYQRSKVDAESPVLSVGSYLELVCHAPRLGPNRWSRDAERRQRGTLLERQ